MKDLEQLILSLQKSIAKSDPNIKTIKNPALLLKSLKELQNLIGNENIKESIASQVSYLIMNKQRKCKNHEMLHSLLVGCPGVGKTMIGTILAKIWYSIGFLKGSKRSDLPKSNISDLLNHFKHEDDNFSNFFLILIFIWFLIMIWYFYSYYGGILTLLVFVSLIILLVGLFYYYNHNHKHKHIDKEDEIIKIIKNVKIEKEISDHDVIKIVSRVDFVHQYCGGTAIKTKALLEENLGKVLFVDEAYSLCHSTQDSFGAEALDTLNLFMSEHPNEIIIVFAGYHDKIEKNLFNIQPGLKRRFMWQFECEGYNSNELYEIFKLKAMNDEFNIENQQEVKKLFDDYYESMPNYGGDCEKVLYFSKLEHSKDAMNNHIDINTLKTDHIKRGILKLRDNSIVSQSDNRELSEYECQTIKETLRKYMKN